LDRTGAQHGPRGNQQRVACGLLVDEGDKSARLPGGIEPDPEQLEKLETVAFRYLVRPVQHALRKVGEQVNEGDARIGRIEIGPFGGVDRDSGDEFVDEILVPAVVDDGDWKGHRLRLPMPARRAGYSAPPFRPRQTRQ